MSTLNLQIKVYFFLKFHAQFNLIWQLIEEDQFFQNFKVFGNGNYDCTDDTFVTLRLFTQISTINIFKIKRL